MLDHVRDLLAHGHDEEEDEVDEQNGPKHGNIKEFEEGHKDRGHNSIRGAIPELELRHAAGKRAVLLAITRGTRQDGAVRLGVDLRREEPNKEVEKINAETVGDDKPAVQEVHADEIKDKKADEDGPPSLQINSGLVEHVLVTPPGLSHKLLKGRRRTRLA